MLSPNYIEVQRPVRSLFLAWFCCVKVFIVLYMQFTRSGHTQLQGNAIMITSTITVVLLTNIVRVVYN